MALEDEIYRDPPSTFEQNYRCYPVSFIEKVYIIYNHITKIHSCR
ncbi:hypothetical protein Hanom_Chr01g00023431 [Helianthus anomalus]